MRGRAWNVVLLLLLGSASAAGALDAPGRNAEPQGVTSEAKKPVKNQKAKPPVPPQPVPPPPPPPKKKKGADPNNDGGAQKSLKMKAKKCARGRLAKLDREAEKLEISTPEETTVGLRLTDKTAIRMSTEPGSWADLKEGMWVTVYCAPEGPRDVATLIRIERRLPPP